MSILILRCSLKYALTLTAYFKAFFKTNLKVTFFFFFFKNVHISFESKTCFLLLFMPNCWCCKGKLIKCHIELFFTCMAEVCSWRIRIIFFLTMESGNCLYSGCFSRMLKGLTVLHTETAQKSFTNFSKFLAYVFFFAYSPLGKKKTQNLRSIFCDGEKEAGNKNFRKGIFSTPWLLSIALWSERCCVLKTKIHVTHTSALKKKIKEISKPPTAVLLILLLVGECCKKSM